ncbi:MAG: ATP-grasp domain-containing protein [Nitriliruptoraceae bacterium]
MATRNLFVIGLDAFNRDTLQAWLDEHAITVHALLETEDVRRADSYRFAELLDRARQQLHGFRGTIDGITTWWDFPSTSLWPILAAEHGCAAPSLAAVLRCEHKYWSRLVQARLAGDHVPRFQPVDPFDDETVAAIDVGIPYWLKPVKSVASNLAFLISNQGDLEHALPLIRAEIGRFGEPFDEVLELVELPDEVAAVTGTWCLAEELLSGEMVTVEGYVHAGEATTYGVVHSVREPGMSSFARYQYPSRLDEDLQRRMTELAERLMTHLGYDHGAFNVEMFHDPETDRIHLLEINPRASQSHADLFEKVDGTPSTAATVELALGERPTRGHRQGPFGCAAKFFVRLHDDARVVAVPTSQQVAAIEDQIPGARIEITVEPGMRLSELHDQDSYSYELAVVYLGADDEEQLLKRYASIEQRLRFELDR